MTDETNTSTAAENQQAAPESATQSAPTPAVQAAQPETPATPAPSEPAKIEHHPVLPAETPKPVHHGPITGGVVHTSAGEMGPLTLTDHQVAFLASRGYKADPVGFVSRMSPEEQKAFFADAEKWNGKDDDEPAPVHQGPILGGVVHKPITGE